MKELTVTSSAFKNNQRIPEKYTCVGEGINPPLSIEGVPEGTKSLALIFDDPDAVGGTFDHWILYNIPPTQSQIGENSSAGIAALNSDQEPVYAPPCPPPGKNHRYAFKFYALDATLTLGVKAAKRDVEKAMKGHILAEGKLVGLFSR
ncbi:MAG: YbhB/YbcL family Raf kinase inhibitor-like protein [Candidatus Bathyarchaeota archaeon]|nr:YbhB/YbcL family Raf kinase inhibitor-like protein [Candidatus Bathyarchaeota archaeon]